MHSTELKNVRGGQGEALRAETSVSPDSPWFSGHFPNDPLLPGIAQLAMVNDLIRLFYPQELVLAGVRRVRFKHIIRPDDSIVIEANPDPKRPTEFQFVLRAEEVIACSGKLVFVEPDRTLREEGQ